MKIKTIYIILLYFNITYCCDFLKVEYSECDFLSVDSYDKCIITINKHKKINHCIKKYGEGIYTIDTIYKSIKFSNCNNNPVYTNTSLNIYKIADNLKKCFEKIKNLKYHNKNINCNKIKKIYK